MKNITDYLIEEVSAEEEELLGSSGGMDQEENVKEGHSTEMTVEKDEKLAKVCLEDFGLTSFIEVMLFNVFLPCSGFGPSDSVSAHCAFH